MRDFPTISSTGRKSKQAGSNAPNNDVPKAKARVYSQRTRGEKLDESDDDVYKSLHYFSYISSFYVGRYS